jgi:hypothetical protein
MTIKKAPKEKKETNIGLIIAVILIVIILGTIAIAATVYVYVSGMLGPSELNETPQLVVMPDLEENTLTVSMIDTQYVMWSELQILGTCNTTDLGTFVEAGDVITECEGYIRIIYMETGQLLYTYTFN